MADTTAQAALRAAFNSKISIIPQTLSEDQKAQARENIGALGINDSSIPSGAVVFFGRLSIPASFLICNGAVVSRSEYSDLFSAIGTTFGSGDGSTTFNLPNIKDLFIQGTTSLSEVGNLVSAGLPNITAQWSTTGYARDSMYNTGAVSFNYDARKSSDGQNSVAGLLTFNAALSSPVYGNSTTVQPPAIKFIACIKI